MDVVRPGVIEFVRHRVIRIADSGNAHRYDDPLAEDGGISIERPTLHCHADEGGI